ncbi:hypothetical protein CHARACLAT_028727 [Characodon lateralis]|uniref:Uncharacterized protein n=1 Tax=Characodon lateralis TaxID=208331 RepID=A0ABU7EN49_9TELE|nr:hypothetical protein [Characodon lateralis]
MKGDHHPSLPVQRHCPRPPRLEVLRADLIQPQSPATMELFNHLCDFSLGDERVQPQVPSLCFHQGMRDGRIEEILEILLPPPNNIPSRGQQLPTLTVNGVGEEVPSPPEGADRLARLASVLPNSSQARDFASATARAAVYLALR